MPAEAPPEVHAQALAWMSEAERLRHGRLTPAARPEHRLARWLVRAALSRVLAVPPERWVFEAPRRGRPFIAGPPEGLGLRFSLSHTPGFLAVAIAAEGAVGLDAEDTSRPGELMGVARRYFTRRELRELDAMATETDRRERFFALWTLKEAYLKAAGLGLRQVLASAFAVGEGTASLVGAGAEGWHFRLLRPTGGHRLAVATDAPAAVELVRLDPATFLA